MATYDISRTTYGSATFAGRIVAFFGNLSAALIGWNDARVTRNNLNALTDRELDDIGLIRGDIDAVANGR
ncbi:MAG: DUF1127 domain-containing protein [Pseudomonadota bacterium]